MSIIGQNILAGASGAGGYTIDQSIRFDDGASGGKLTFTPSSDATSDQKLTFSFWAKGKTDIAGLNDNKDFEFLTAIGSDWDSFGFGRHDGDFTLTFTGGGQSGHGYLTTTQYLQDPSAWYHIVGAIDTTLATAGDRMKLYINGTEVTAFATDTNPTQNYTTTGFNNNGTAQVIARSQDGTYPSGCYMAEVHMIDGQQLTAASFGEFNVDSNEWVPIKYGGTYGTNGYFLKFAEGGFITYDRTSEIAVTSSFTWLNSGSGNTDGEDLVNGILTNNDAGGGWMPSGSVTDRWIKFDFVTGKIYKACNYISINSSGSEGTWKWQGSNDDAAWTDIGGTFTLGGNDPGVVNATYTLNNTLNANTTSYRYYRILAISGTGNTSGRRLAMYFSESTAGPGNDSSGNGNNFVAANLGITHQVPDSPTNNWATMNPVDTLGTVASSDGNLKVTTGIGNDPEMRGTIAIPTTGKWYFEFLDQTSTSIMTGIVNQSNSTAAYGSNLSVLYTSGNGNIYNCAAVASYGASWTNGDIIGVAINMDDNEMTFYKNNATQGTVTIAGTPLNYWIPTVMTGTGSSLGGGTVNFGQDSSFDGAETAQGNQDANEIGDFYYAPPTDYLSLCSDNLSDPAIALPSEYFNTVLYSGNSTADRAVTGVGFEPEFVWVKARTGGSEDHTWCDIIRGTGNHIRSNSNAAEITSLGLTSFDSDGFTLPNHNQVNGTGYTYVAWNWEGGGTPTADNSAGAGNVPTAGSVKINGSNSGAALAGTIPATRLTANTTSGFSVVGYTSPNTTVDETIGHGLSAAPEMVIVKNLDLAWGWDVWTPALASGYDLKLNDTAAQGSGRWSTTAPTASVVTLKYNYEHNSTNEYIAYCFHSVEGYLKVGSYSSNNSADGPFLYLGFTPAYILLKCYDTADNWNIYDIKRDGYNGIGGTYQLRADTTSAGFTSAATMVDLVSNGMKIRTNDPGTNGSSRNYIYIAFAESPFKTSNAR